MRTKQAAVKFFKELGMHFTAHDLENRSDDWWQQRGDSYEQIIKIMCINSQGYESALEEALNEDSKRWKWNA